MTMNRVFTKLSLALLLVAGTARAEVLPFDLEVGYRWLSLSGNEGMYRTQINERSGLLIRAFTMTSPTPFADRFRVDVSDLGVGPAGGFRLEADRRDLYRFRLGYRSANVFSELPAFANPLLGSGVIPGQHTYDRTRRTIDADVEIFPERNIVPFLGYSLNHFNGPGRTTYHVGQDEFLLGQSLDDREHEVRAGAAFRFTRFYGQFTQGWRRFNSNETLALVAPQSGNNTTPILGRDISATDIRRSESIRVNTPFTNFYVTGDVAPHVRVIANYVRFNADQNGDENESATGSFASFAAGRFFNGLTETASSNAKNTTWRGGARAEVSIINNVDAFGGFEREHRDLRGTALINTVLLQSITFGGADPHDLATALNANSSVDRDQDVLNAGVNARVLGPISFRAEFRETKQDVTVSADASEIVVPGAQGGSFDRRIHTFDVNAGYTKSGLTLGAAWRHDSADTPIFRTDYLGRNRYRLRAQYRAPKYVRIGAVAEQLKQNNDRPDVAYDAKIRQYTGNVDITPIEHLTFRASASRFKSDSTALFLRPETLSPSTSIQTENGRSREGGVSFTMKRVGLDASVTRFRNTGSNPFTIDRYAARATVGLKAKTGVAFEWNKDKYDEPLPSYGNYDASRYGIYLRWKP
jgi:hypothetical protein